MININDVFSLLLSLLGIILILFSTYYSTKWLSTKTNLTMRSRYMNIVDKIMLGQNKFLAIAQICNKYYLISITEKNINIINELEDFRPLFDEKTDKMEFINVFKKVLKK